MVEHAYPRQLAVYVNDHWEMPCSHLGESLPLDTTSTDGLPDFDVLEGLLSTCYQASLLRDEERPTRFRLMLQDPERLAPDQGPPRGLHRLIFTTPRPFNELELRRLSPSTSFQHSLIGARLNADRVLEIWGLLHSGPRWLQTLYGGGKSFFPLPNALVVHVTNPGRLTVCKGSLTVATLNAGQINCPSVDVFDSRWLQAGFAASRTEVWRLHQEARARARTSWARIDTHFLRIVKKQVIMRVISMVRNAHHGGTVICIPDEMVSVFSAENDYMQFKYRFRDGEPRSRFRTLLLNVANALAEAYGEGEEREVGWQEYLESKNQTLYRLDEAIFEWAHLVAGLTAVDGAVCITRRFDLLGFGAEISGGIARVGRVAHALDPEASRIDVDDTSWVGTRHHSAYRLCNALHEVIGMVVSQDGTVQIIKWKDGLVTCWNQVGSSTMDA